MIVTSFLDFKLREKQISPTFSYKQCTIARNKKMAEKSVFREAWSPEVTSQSFPVSRFCTPPEVEFDSFGSSEHGEGKSLSKIFLCYTYPYIEEI